VSGHLKYTTIFLYFEHLATPLDSRQEAHRAALISVSLALSQTPVYTPRPQMRG